MGLKGATLLELLTLECVKDASTTTILYLMAIVTHSGATDNGFTVIYLVNCDQYI